MDLLSLQAELLDLITIRNVNNIKTSSFWKYIKDLDGVEQDPIYHQEGNVLTHTLLVCEKFFKTIESWKEYDDNILAAILCACIFHDIGKLKTTKVEDDKIVSPHHSSIGANMTREILWNDYNLCGDYEAFRFRELVCNLIQYHMYLPHFFDTPENQSELKYTKVAELARLTPDYNWGLQYIVSYCDNLGRECSDKKEQLETLFLSSVAVDDLGVLCGAYNFLDPYTKREYFKGKNVWKGQELHNASWGNVYIFCGLPGTGKDTYIKDNEPYNKLPMISLDNIRKDLKITNADNQGSVLQLAKEKAKEYLREHREFVWNATNLIKDRRQMIIELCENYGANVNIIYLETTNTNQLERNNNRKEVVPQEIVFKMRSKISIPSPDEAYKVQYQMV